MSLEELFSSYTLKKQRPAVEPPQPSSSTFSSTASSRMSLNSTHLKMFQCIVGSLPPPYSNPPIVETYPRNCDDKHYTLFIEHLSSRYIRALELSDRLNRKVFDILWSMFPDCVQCFRCHCLIARNHHKKMFWDFRNASINCSNCIFIDDLRLGYVTSLVSLLSPTFSQCIERNLRQNYTVYEGFIPRFGFYYAPSAFAVLNGLRRYNSDVYQERHCIIRNDLFEMHFLNSCEMETDNEIGEIRAMLVTQTACFKIVDICFAFAIKSLQTYVPPKVCCGCGKSGSRKGCGQR